WLPLDIAARLFSTPPPTLWTRCLLSSSSGIFCFFLQLRVSLFPKHKLHKRLARLLCPPLHHPVLASSAGREPLSLINLRKRNVESGEEELASRLDHYKAKATRHIFLIRHSQYHVDGSLEKDRTLTALGREQAELTGLRLASLGLKFNKIVHSSMTRAVETTEIISKHLPGVCRVSTDLLREGAPIEPDPPVSHWKPEAVQYYEDGARIEAAFRNYIHRADARQEEDSYEIFICHANVIRYIVCRALQFPPEGWLRLSLNNGSITHLVIRPNGRVALRTLGDTGFMPPDKITRS
uniref:Serine/threonine-protein phosphatase PGAM5, mitochondrial n=1 Tax=Oryctolagus cuniculus TaxID=9986 RepID=G1TZI2_RABIT